MRLKMFCAAVLSFGLTATFFAQAPAAPATAGQAPDSKPAQQLSVQERGRIAVSKVLSGRLKPPASYDEATPEQKAFVDSVLSGQRTALTGITGTLMLSPTMGDLAQKAIGYTRFDSTVPVKLNELAIIITARYWTSQIEWNAHRPAAERAGISHDVVDAIRVGKRPTNMPPDVEAIYNFCTELLNTRQMSDATFKAARETLGSDQRIVDLVATMAMYQFTAMTMNVDETPLGPNAKPELMPLSSDH